MNREDTATQADERAVMSTFTAEGIVAVLLFVIGAIAIYGAVDLGASWGDDGPEAGYFPFYVGLILCAASVVNFVSGVFGRRRKTTPFVTRGPARQVLLVLFPAIVYVGVLQLIGTYVASAIYIAFFMRFIGKYGALKSVLTAVIVCAVFFVMFEVWFLVPLYKGIYNPLAFTGY
jgi:hypothetical protein